MSRNNGNMNGRGMKRNIGRNRQISSPTATTGTSGRQTIKEAAYRRANNNGSDMRYCSRSHYAAVGTASLPCRAGRRF